MPSPQRDCNESVLMFHMFQKHFMGATAKILPCSTSEVMKKTLNPVWHEKPEQVPGYDKDDVLENKYGVVTIDILTGKDDETRSPGYCTTSAVCYPHSG